MSYQTISADEFAKRIQSDDRPLCVDVRTSAEYAGVRCQGSVNLPLQDLTADQLKEVVLDRALGVDSTVYLICQAGKRSEMAADKICSELTSPVCVVAGGVQALPASVQERGEQNVMSLERQVRIAAGALVLLGVVAGVFVTPWAYALSGFVGAGLVFAGITDTCGMAMVLARMPWNKAA
ncbi:rhodanese-like domain-containing protein [Pseudomaricurvus sp.]|uniref:rhodanese-like domain-containing protein n=1 Tax=Pseudomaricurvus sp. TaxID=2004510 RepID=UPI003F6D12F2